MITASQVLTSSVARVAFALIYAAQAFYMMPFLVSHLGERWYGIWVLVAGVVATSYLLDLGLTSAVMRSMAKAIGEKDVDAANHVVNTCLVIYTALGGVIAVGSVVLASLAERFVEDPAALGTVRLVFLILGLTYATEFPFKAFSGIVSTYMRYDLLMAPRLVSLTLTNVAYILLLRRGYGLVAMALTTFTISQVSAIIYYRIARGLFRELRISPALVRRDLVPALFSYSIWSLAIQFANTMRFGVDSFVIGWMRSATAVTYYAVALRLAEFFADIINKATNMMMPVFAVDFFQNNLDDLRRKYLLTVRITAVPAVFGGGMIAILGKGFILRWMGPQFEQSYSVLVVLIVAMVFEVLANASDNMLFALDKHRYLAWASGVEALVNLVLSLLLIGPFGLVGVAAGTAVPLIISRAVVVPLITVRALGIPITRYYRNLAPVFAFAIAFLSVVAVAAAQLDGPPSYASIAMVAGLASPLYVVGSVFVVFSAAERALLLRLLPASVRRLTARGEA